MKVSEEELAAWSEMAGSTPVTTWMRERLNAISSAPVGLPAKERTQPSPGPITAPKITHPIYEPPKKIVAPRASQEVARPPSRLDGLGIPNKADLDAAAEAERQQAREARLRKNGDL